MCVRVLLSLSAAGLLTAFAAAPSAAGRSLTEHEMWSVTGAAGRCCAANPDCADDLADRPAAPPDDNYPSANDRCLFSGVANCGAS